jgi:hypothetical protein
MMWNKYDPSNSTCVDCGYAGWCQDDSDFDAAWRRESCPLPRKGEVKLEDAIEGLMHGGYGVTFIGEPDGWEVEVRKNGINESGLPYYIYIGDATAYTFLQILGLAQDIISADKESR